MKRIMIIGFSGCGKSTLAKTLGHILNISPTHIDRFQFKPGWVETSREEKRTKLAPIINSEQWIIDGVYFKCLFDECAERADTIIFLDFNRFLCLYRVVKRRIMYRNRVRPDMASGCMEKLDFEFMRWVFFTGRRNRRKILSMLEQQRNKCVYVFKNPRQLSEFVDKVRKGMIS